MPNTYTQLYIHFIFAVKYREALINENWEEKLRKYMTGIIQNQGHKLLVINNMPDHMHILLGLNPKQSISDLMRILKSDSSEFVNKENLTPIKFHWQEGYGAFSHSRSQIDQVSKYIMSQKEHHKRFDFREEFIKILKDFEVEFKEEYIFKDLE